MILTVNGLKKHFPMKGGLFGRTIGFVHAVDGVSFDVDSGETLGVVGESGCGKTTLGRVVLGLVKATSGEVLFEGRNIFNMRENEARRIRRDMQIVFQDPFDSLDPRQTVIDIIGEPLIVHNICKGKELVERVVDLLTKVGLTKDHLYRLPHEFSGGQRQRIAVARAIALNPKFIVLDEPTSALDVSVQAQILGILRDLQRQLKLTYLFISHDLSVVRYMSSRISVMYLGKIVEVGITEDVFTKPLHPYTQALLKAIPVPDPDMAKWTIRFKRDVEIPSAVNPPSGCRFHTRCLHAQPICRETEPPLEETPHGNGHYVTCHFWQSLTEQTPDSA